MGSSGCVAYLTQGSQPARGYMFVTVESLSASGQEENLMMCSLPSQRLQSGRCKTRNVLPRPDERSRSCQVVMEEEAVQGEVEDMQGKQQTRLHSRRQDHPRMCKDKL